MAEPADIGTFILAGGKSSRMGASKPLLDLGGETLLTRTVRLAAPFAERCSGIGSAELRAHTQARVLEDAWPGCGPLGGIATALNLEMNLAERNLASQTWNLILACDMPYLTPEWLCYLIARAVASETDVVMAAHDLEVEGGPEGGPKRGRAHDLEPLCAMYRSAAGAAIAAALERGVRKVTDGLAGLNVEMVEPAEWKQFDSQGRLFKNVNTPEDYQAAKAFFEAAAGGGMVKQRASE
jgi:molybdopterin-guanine dinucleotide biosynthesis protein A